MRYWAVFFLCCLPCCHLSYPSFSDVDATIAECINEPNHDEKVQELKNLLEKLKHTETVENDKVLDYAIQQLGKSYLQYHEIAILDAVDATPKDLGFATSFEQFYIDVSKDPAFLARCRRDPEALRAFQDGTWQSYSEEDVTRILEGGKPTS